MRGNTLRSTPLGDLDQAIRLFEGIFLKTSASSRRNRPEPLPDLAHAHSTVLISVSFTIVAIGIFVVGMLIGRHFREEWNKPKLSKKS